MPRGKKRKFTKKGRVSSYNPDEYPRMAYVACSELGATNEDLAALFGMSKGTILWWLRDYEMFKKAVRAGRDVFDSGRVEAALRSRALGYSTEEKKYELKPVYEHGEVKRDPQGNPILREYLTERKIKEVAPNVTAAVFWLQNRQSERWKNVRRVEATIKKSGEEHVWHHRDGLTADDLLKNVKDKHELELIRDILARAVRSGDGDSDVGSSRSGTGDEVPGSFH